MKSFEIHETVDRITEDAVRESATSKIQAGAVLMVTRSGILRHTFPVAVACREVTLNQDLKALVPLAGLHPQYVAYALRAFARRILHTCSKDGTTVQSIEFPALKRFEIPIAPCAEQARIVDALEELFSDLDAGVAALERVRDRLKLYRASVLKAAVEGTLTAEWRAEHPHTEPASELLERILVERRRRWEEGQFAKSAAKGQKPPKNWKARYSEPVAPEDTQSEVLPSGWCWTSLGQCFDVHVGATPSRGTKSYWNGDVPWVTSGEIQFCRIPQTRETITAEGVANSSTRLNPIGSVMLNMIGEGATRGKAGILDIAACNNQNCAAIWVSQTSVLPEFIYLWLLFRYEHTRDLGSGNNQPAMNKTIVQGIGFPLPSLAEQEAIVDLVEDQLSVIDHLESEIDSKLKSAHSLRQAILRHAFTGQLVSQDPNDEPASELLKRITAERQGRGNEAHPHPAAPRARPVRQRRRK